MTQSEKPIKQIERTLKSNIFSEPLSLDPRLQSDITSESLLHPLFEGLTRFSSDLTVEMAQAKSVDISSDGTVYTFHLNDNRWSDGSPIYANDFSQTWLDLLTPEFAAPNAHLLSPIKNAVLAKRGEVPLSDVGIRTLDDQTLEVTLSAPFPAFLHITAIGYLAPISHTQAQLFPNWATNASRHLSNGPFRLSAWKRGQEIRMERNPYYRGGAPKLDAIDFSVLNTDASALQLIMYANGNFDLIGTPLAPIPLSYLKDLLARQALHTADVASSMFVCFDVRRFPFSNVNIRKAFSYAINRRRIIEEVTQLGEELALGAVPPILKNGKKVNWIADGDEKLAQRFLEQGLKELNAPKSAFDNLTFFYWPMEISFKVAEAIQRDWQKTLGVYVKLVGRDMHSIFAAGREQQFQVGLFAWMAEYCDVSALLERFRYADEFKNYSHWSHPRYVDLLDASSSEADPQKRLAILEQAEKILIDEMPIAPIYHGKYAYLVHPKIQGFKINPLGQVFFEELTIKNNSRSQRRS